MSNHQRPNVYKNFTNPKAPKMEHNQENTISSHNRRRQSQPIQPTMPLIRNSFPQEVPRSAEKISAARQKSPFSFVPLQLNDNQAQEVWPGDPR